MANNNNNLPGRELTHDEYYQMTLSSRQDGTHHQSIQQTSEDNTNPSNTNPSNSQRHDESRNIFHLQQELLRQELPQAQEQWVDIRQQQSHRLEQLLQQEQLILQRRKMEALRMELEKNGAKLDAIRQQGLLGGQDNNSMMGGGFGLIGSQPNNMMVSETHLCFPTQQIMPTQEHHDTGMMPPSTVAQSYYTTNNSVRNERSKSMGSSPAPSYLANVENRAMNGSSFANDNNAAIPNTRKSYHDEPNFQFQTQQQQQHARTSPHTLNASYGSSDGLFAVGNNINFVATRFHDGSTNNNFQSHLQDHTRASPRDLNMAANNIGASRNNAVNQEGGGVALGNNGFFERRSYHDEQQQQQQQNRQSHSQQYAHTSPSPTEVVGHNNSTYNNGTGFQPQAVRQQYANNSAPPSHTASPCTLWLQSSAGQGGGLAAPPPASNSSSGSNKHSSRSTEMSASLKRRRLNEKLLLEMLTDTVVSPTNATKETLQASDTPPGNYTIDNARDKVAALLEGGSMSSISPYAAYAKPAFSSYTENAGNTPGLFADLFLGEECGGGSSGHGEMLDLSGMPPPPLVRAEVEAKGGNGEAGHLEETSLNERAAAGTASHDAGATTSPIPEKFDSLTLPLKKSQQTGQAQGKKKSSSRPKGQKKAVDTSNHIITPSSAVISALSREVRSQMKKTSSSQDGDAVSSGPNSPGTADSINNKNDADNNACFSIPHFASTMQATQSSQQAIHDWDRKFGLRRAHSKTMRESCRSRKRVLEFLLKGEGATLVLLQTSRANSREDGATSNTDETAFVPDKIMTKEEMGDAAPVDKVSCEQVQEKSKPSSNNSESPYQSDEVVKNSDDVSKDTPSSPANSNSSVDDQLERMFRRASLDNIKNLQYGESVSPPMQRPRDEDRKQTHARGA